MPDLSELASVLETALEVTLDKVLDPGETTSRTRNERSSVTRTRSQEPREVLQTWYIEVDSPIGPLTVVSQGDAIVGLYMRVHRHGPTDRDSWLPDVNEHVDVLNQARVQLSEYFAGKRQRFELRLAPYGTDVQHRVWRALSDIPFSETRSYGEIAAIIGSPKASRAVGAANGRNPISIIVPCHRVIGSNGALTGFGGGIERKEWLLNHEARVAGKPEIFLAL